jgi:hypothetical protein
MYVLYRLKSGREVKRYIYFGGRGDYSQQTMALLNNIVTTEEYKKGAYIELADYYGEYWLGDKGRGWYQEYIFHATRNYGNQLDEDVVLPLNRFRDMPRLLEAYRQDLWALSYYDIRNVSDYDYGEIRMSLEWDGRYAEERSFYSGRTNTNITVKSWAVRTEAVLRELGASFYNYNNEWLWQPEYEGGL